jgi:hypothetical protein
MTLKLIEFIKEHPTDWREILSNPPYSIIIKEDEEYMLLKYNQIESKFNEPEAFKNIRESRGIILRKDNYKPVCVPFYKFGNYGEGYADKIDFNNARVQQKVDGSLIKVWYDNNKWHISTNGTIDAFKAECPTGETFGDLFLEGFKNVISCETFESYCNLLHKEFTYMFEMVHHLTRIVIRYDKPRIFHIGTRNNESMEELNTDINIPKPQEYKFNSLEDVIAMAQNLPYSEEGYVVVDNKWNRVKIKSPSYLAVHHLKNNGVITYKRIMELVFKNETEEFLVYFPEFKDYFVKCENKYKEYIEGMKEGIEKIRNMVFVSPKEDVKAYRKEYAMAVIKTPAPDFFFKVMDNKYTWNDFDKYVRDNGAEKLVKILNLKDEKVKDPEITLDN